MHGMSIYHSQTLSNVQASMPCRPATCCLAQSTSCNGHPRAAYLTVRQLAAAQDPCQVAIQLQAPLVDKTHVLAAGHSSRAVGQAHSVVPHHGLEQTGKPPSSMRCLLRNLMSWLKDPVAQQWVERVPQRGQGQIRWLYSPTRPFSSRQFLFLVKRVIDKTGQIRWLAAG